MKPVIKLIVVSILVICAVTFAILRTPSWESAVIEHQDVLTMAGGALAFLITLITITYTINKSRGGS